MLTLEPMQYLNHFFLKQKKTKNHLNYYNYSYINTLLIIISTAISCHYIYIWESYNKTHSAERSGYFRTGPRACPRQLLPFQWVTWETSLLTASIHVVFFFTVVYIYIYIHYMYTIYILYVYIYKLYIHI